MASGMISRPANASGERRPDSWQPEREERNLDAEEGILRIQDGQRDGAIIDTELGDRGVKTARVFRYIRWKTHFHPYGARPTAFPRRQE